MKRILSPVVGLFCLLCAQQLMFAGGGQDTRSPAQPRCSYPRPIVTDTKPDVPFEYKGFVIDMCGFVETEDRTVMLAALRRQVDLVEAMNLSPEVIVAIHSRSSRRGVSCCR